MLQTPAKNGLSVAMANYQKAWRGQGRRETFYVSVVVCASLRALIRAIAIAIAIAPRPIAITRGAAGCFHHRDLLPRHDLGAVPEGAHRRLVAREDVRLHLDPEVAPEDARLDPEVAPEDARLRPDPEAVPEDAHLDPEAVPEDAHPDPAAVREVARHRHNRAGVPAADVHSQADGRDRNQAADGSPNAIAGYTKGGPGNNCPSTNRWQTSRQENPPRPRTSG
jgi:hypothetical protein